MTPISSHGPGAAGGNPLWPRPVPTVGDPTSAAERAADPQGWAFPADDADALERIIAGRRDIRRFRPDPVPPEVLRRILAAAHAAPSVGHSQPWRFVIVEDPETRQRAATLADRERLAQAAGLDEASGRHLLDLDLEGIREAPLGLVVCCDRRAPAGGVLGRATLVDADMWSCACAIQNLWLAARAEGIGVGWVTLFHPDDLRCLVGAPEGVATLGWLCLGWPDERPPEPGLQRRGWSQRQPLDDVVLYERWPTAPVPPPPVSRLAGDDSRLPDATEPRITAPPPAAVVSAHDRSDGMLTPPRSLGVLDTVIDRIAALGLDDLTTGTLVIAAADHPVAGLGVSAYDPIVTRHVADAARAGQALGATAAATAGLEVIVVDAGVAGAPLGPPALVYRPVDARGDLATSDALSAADTQRLVTAGQQLGARLAGRGLVALGEIGVANTTVAAALAALCLDLSAEEAVGLGAGADRHMVDRKADVVRAVLGRVGADRSPSTLLAIAGGPEIAVLTGVTLGVAEAGGLVVLDGLATSVAAVLAVRWAPGVAAHLVAGHRSRELAHRPVLAALGLEPLLDLRIRAGEGAGAALAAGLMLASLEMRRRVARTR